MLNFIWKKRLVFVVIAMFILTSVIPSIMGEGEDYFLANQDIPVSNGGISGDYTDTFSSDDNYEEISEMETNGKPSNRYSYLEHKWTFELTGSFTSIDFYIEAYHTTNSEGDDFVFAYSTNDVDYTDILTVTKTADNNTYQGASMPDTLSGTLYICVKDKDRTGGNRYLDKIYIDRMYLQGTEETDETPPIISYVTAIDNDDTWYDMAPNSIDGTLTPRWLPGMVYDSNANKVIMFGGEGYKGPFNDTWVYDYTDNTWYNMSPDINGENPYRRYAPGMVYDSQADRVIMFGGWSYIEGKGWISFNDTWSYNYTDNKWYNMSPSYDGGELPKMAGCGMVYDSTADRTILFGGFSDNVFLNETWTYDYTSNTWYNMSPKIQGGNLYTRAIFGLVYDSVNDKTIMYGGNKDGYSILNDTWVYDYSDNTWYKMNPSFVDGELSARYGFGMTFDSNAGCVVLFGGIIHPSQEILENDTWIYNFADNTWRKVIYTQYGQNLYIREGCTIAYDSTEKHTIMFGGWADEFYVNDTWIFKMDDITATIQWTTDEPSDSVVNYGTIDLGDTAQDTTLVTNHRIILTDLIADTTYCYEVQSTDQSGNTAVDNNGEEYYTFSTTQPPVISNIAADEVTHSTATITWDTDEPSNSEIRYGTTIPPENIISDSSLVINHSLQLTYLEPETKYYYEVQSTDYSGRTTIDDNGGDYYSFTTSIEPSNSMHVQSIDMWYYQQGQRFRLYTIVQMVDENDDPVDDAMVYLSINISIGSYTRIVYESNDLTNITGYVTFFYETKIKGLYIATVNDVVKEDWTYHPEDNVETSESIYVR